MIIDIEELKRVMKKSSMLYKDEFIDSIVLALEQQQARIKELEKASEWISVDDRLPNDDGGYLTCVNDDEDFYINYFINYFGDDDVVEWTTDQNVTHWKPLPKPPEKK